MIQWLFLLLLQSYVLTPERAIPVETSDFTVDALGNIYLVYDYHLEKLAPDGKVLYRSSDLGYGRIHRIDVSNPLKPFLYYQDQNVIINLDNTLSQQGNAIDLRDFDFTMVELAGASRDNCYWLWDSPRSALIRTDKDMKVLYSTPNLGNLLGMELHPMAVTETATGVFLVDPAAGVLVFDIYGTYRTRIHLNFDGEIQVSGNHLLYHQGKNLNIINPDIPGTETIELPAVPGNQVIYNNGHLYFISEKMLQVYTVETSRD
jgi:hypothetical protein